MEEKTYHVSRMFGTFFFPASLTVLPSGVRYSKGKLIGGNEELINYGHIASVRLKKGLFTATLEIETSGGSAPIVIPGLYKSDAIEIRDAIEHAQAHLSP
ncbi:MAG: hypothetical protein JWM95_3129 [Gemmatimonadetes bacterium]|nr:hypothetical protein [Gemmatimonadota bacterium]